MGNLPEEEDPEQNPPQGRDRALGGGPADEGGKGARDRPDLSAPIAGALGRGVPTQVEGDGQQGEKGGQLSDQGEDDHQGRDAHQPPEDESGAACYLARGDRPERGPVHLGVGVALHPLVERRHPARGKGGSDDQEPDLGRSPGGARGKIAHEGGQDGQEAKPRLGELQVVGEPSLPFGCLGHGLALSCRLSRCATQVIQKVVARVTAPTRTWPVVTPTARCVIMILAPNKI